MNVYKTFIRPALFVLPAETAHGLGMWALRPRRAWEALRPALTFEHDVLRQRAGGLDLVNPVGLGPGFDKDCDVLGSLACVGFGFLEGGTVMPRPREGNPRPRLLRYPHQTALVNCMGLPSCGVDECVKHLRRGREMRSPSIPVLVSFMGFTPEEYVSAFRALQPWADALEVALRCPNTPDERSFVERDEFASLLTQLTAHKSKPIWVKLPSLDVEVDRTHFVDLVELGLRLGVDGFVVSGTHPVDDPRLSRGRGSLSGRPVLGRTLQSVRAAYGKTLGRAPIIAQGGIASGSDAFAAIAAGANAVSVFTQLIYEGPGLVRRINQDLVALMSGHGIGSIQELCGREEARGDRSVVDGRPAMLPPGATVPGASDGTSPRMAG
jgi:dihydroorotate dehydrogenase